MKDLKVKFGPVHNRFFYDNRWYPAHCPVTLSDQIWNKESEGLLLLRFEDNDVEKDWVMNPNLLRRAGYDIINVDKNDEDIPKGSLQYMKDFVVRRFEGVKDAGV